MWWIPSIGCMSCAPCAGEAGSLASASIACVACGRKDRPIGDDEAMPPSRVSLFITCFNDTMFPETGQAVVTVLERLGVGVDFPLEQTCCGQMHFNTGYAEETIPLVRRFVRVFGDSEL